jgi:branched-chain amino acid transport system substrate-binding protein
VRRFRDHQLDPGPQHRGPPKKEETSVRTRSLAKIAVIGVVGVMALSACSNKKTATGGLTGGSASGNTGNSKSYKIAFQGPLSGDNQQLGINEVNAVELAVDQANASGNLGFKLSLFKSDDVGLADKAPAAAAAILQDNSIVGVIGPSFSGATKAVGKTYADAGMAVISPSATNGKLTSLGFSTFHRVVPPDSVEGQQVADWMAKKAKKVFVVDDLSDYGKGVADDVQKELKAKGVTVVRQGVDSKTTDYGAISQTVKSSGAQTMFYGGYDAQAALFARALKSAGYAGVTVTGNGGKSSVFTKGAGSAGDGWYFSCGCLDATVAPEAKSFETAYKAKFNTPSSTYSPEAYDATNAMISVLKALASKGDITRKAVEEGVNSLDFKGITTTIKFETNGEVQQQVINLYQQKNGVIGLIGDIKSQS